MMGKIKKKKYYLVILFWENDFYSIETVFMEQNIVHPTILSMCQEIEAIHYFDEKAIKIWINFGKTIILLDKTGGSKSKQNKQLCKYLLRTIVVVGKVNTFYLPGM